MKNLSLVSLLLISLNAFAAPPTISGATGLSRYSNLKTPVIYGGMVGVVTPTDGVHTVDTCAVNGTVLQACNTSSIYGTLELRIFAKHRNMGNLFLTHEGKMLLLSSRPNPDFAGVQWNDLCYQMGGASCESLVGTHLAKFRVHVDRNTNGAVDRGEEGAEFYVKFVHVPAGMDVADGTFGLTGFTPTPGNKKIIIEDPEIAAPGTLFTSYGSPIKSVRVFISTLNMADATPGSGLSPVDLKITPRGTISKATIGSLKNGQRVWVRTGMVDEAGNVISLFPGAGVESCDAGGPAPCHYSATPSRF